MMDLKKLQKQIEDVARGGLRKLGVTTAGSAFFTGARKGESAELQADLNSNSKTKQSNALKRVIANMSLGRDVSQLFADVVKLGQSSNLEIKKLVYLYVLSNARLQQEKALLAVNTFLNDCKTHPSPIIRALAIRTMLCLRVDSVLEYLIQPLKQALTVDGDPYVRKTAALGILKLFHQKPKVIEDHGFLPMLVQLIADSNPVVASNAAAALHEIVTHRAASGAPISLPANWANKLLLILPECNEWGQCYILDLLSSFFEPADNQIEDTIERIIPRLSHLNPAVVFAAVKSVLQYVPRVTSEQSRAQYLTRVNNALITLSRSDSETQYVVIKNIQALLPIFPGLLRDKIDGFYVRFNDSLCVKKEKLRLLMMLMHKDNASAIAKELEEYATDVDTIFLAKVVHAVSIASIKQESIAPRCVKILQSIAEKQREMLPNVFIASKNLLRRHPNLAVDLMKPLLTSIDHISSSVADDLEATVALVWILGEFCDVLANGMETLDYFTSSFSSLEPAVQNAIMTALVKLFLRNPAQVEPLLTPLFETATGASSCDPDVRDRAFMYYRLLAKGIGIERMKSLVHSAKPAIDVTDSSRVNKGCTSLSEVLSNLNTAAVALEKPAKSFILPYGLRPLSGPGGDVATGDGEDDDDQAADLPVVENGDDAAAGAVGPGAGVGRKPAAAGGGNSLDDIFGGGNYHNQQQQSQSTTTKPVVAGAGGAGIDAIFGGGATTPPGSSASHHHQQAAHVKPPVDPFATIAPPASSLGGVVRTAATTGNNANASPLDSMFSGGSGNVNNRPSNDFDPFGPPAQQQQQQKQPPKNAVDELFG